MGYTKDLLKELTKNIPPDEHKRHSITYNVELDALELSVCHNDRFWLFQIQVDTDELEDVEGDVLSIKDGISLAENIYPESGCCGGNCQCNCE